MPNAGNARDTPRTGSSAPFRGRSYSMMPLKYAPPARPAGFHHVAEESSATAVNAPAMPSARTPTSSELCASVTIGAEITTKDTKDTKALNIAFYLSVLCVLGGEAAGGK